MTGPADTTFRATFVLGFATVKVDCTFTWEQYKDPKFEYTVSNTGKLQVTPASPCPLNIQGNTASLTLTCRKPRC